MLKFYSQTPHKFGIIKKKILDYWYAQPKIYAIIISTVKTYRTIISL